MNKAKHISVLVDSLKQLTGCKFKLLVGIFLAIFTTLGLMTLLNDLLLSNTELAYPSATGNHILERIHTIMLVHFTYWTDMIWQKLLIWFVILIFLTPLYIGLAGMAQDRTQGKDIKILNFWAYYSNKASIKVIIYGAVVFAIITLIVNIFFVCIAPGLISLTPHHSFIILAGYVVITPLFKSFLIFTLLNMRPENHAKSPLSAAGSALVMTLRHLLTVWCYYIIATIVFVLGIVTLIGWIWLAPLSVLIMANTYNKLVEHDNKL